MRDADADLAAVAAMYGADMLNTRESDESRATDVVCSAANQTVHQTVSAERRERTSKR